MDSKIEQLTELMEMKRDKYPNITSVWRNYIKQKQEFFEKVLDNGIMLFSDIETRQETDIDYETILAIYLLMNRAN